MKFFMLRSSLPPDAPEVQSGIFGLEPYYIRKSEAEELWEQKHGKQ